MADVGIDRAGHSARARQDAGGAHNASAWSARGAARLYRKADALFPVESVILARHATELSAARLLDIGVGTGRTTGHLEQRCRDYVGIDYSAAMLAAARRRFPASDLAEADARDMRRYGDGSFDAAIFSYNGIDYVPHADRLAILAEVRRVLRSGGLFIFSSHNRDCSVPPAASLSNLRFSRNPVRLALNGFHYLAGIANARRTRGLERAEAEYALINDPGLYFRLVTYYIERAAQSAQLVSAGFEPPRAFDLAGRELPIAGAPVSDFMLHYVTRKTGA